MNNLNLQLERALDKVTAKTCGGLIRKIRDAENAFWRDDAVLDEKNLFHVYFVLYLFSINCSRFYWRY